MNDSGNHSPPNNKLSGENDEALDGYSMIPMMRLAANASGATINSGGSEHVERDKRAGTI